MTARAEVKLDHKSGPVVITISAEDPAVAAYMANRLKEVFGGDKTRPKSDAVSDLMRAMGIGQ